MAHIHDVIPPEIVDSGEFADAMNSSCSYKTDRGRTLDMLEIAIFKIARLEAKVDKLNKQVTMLLEALTAGK